MSVAENEDSLINKGSDFSSKVYFWLAFHILLLVAALRFVLESVITPFAVHVNEGLVIVVTGDEAYIETNEQVDEVA